MGNKLGSMSVGHDYAPGAEPTFYDLYLYWFHKVMSSPAAMIALVIVSVAFTVVLAFKIISRRRAVEKEEEKRRLSSPVDGETDLAALRRSRQAKAQGIDASSEA